MLKKDGMGKRHGAHDDASSEGGSTSVSGNLSKAFVGTRSPIGAAQNVKIAIYSHPFLEHSPPILSLPNLQDQELMSGCPWRCDRITPSIYFRIILDDR